MPNSAIYCRVSTEDQEREGTSLDSQKDACEKKARELNLSISHTFLEAYSGLSLDRPKLSILRDLIRNHRVDVVIAYSLDRLSRDPVHFIILQDEMEKAGVQLILVTETVDGSDMGKLISHIRGFAAKLEAQKIAERTIRGKRQKAKEGIFAMGGPAPSGYIRVKNDQNKTVRIIDEDQAKVIIQIFTWIGDTGYSLYKVTTLLKQSGIMTPTGKVWSEVAVCRLIHNPIYKGVTYAFKTTVKGNTHKPTNPETWISVPGATPAIVGPELWERAGERLKQNRLKSRKNSVHSYLLSHRMKCGTCGHSMTGFAKKTRHGKTALYYRCITGAKPNYYDACGSRMVRADKAEAVVWRTIDGALRDRKTIFESINIKKQEHDPAVIQADEILLVNSIAGIKKEKARYLRLYGIGKLEEAAYLNEADRLEAKNVELENKLALLKEQIVRSKTPLSG